ncbi:MAG: ribbon-helix-helix protein, CopG family [Thermoguttaceae bacterium]
MTVTIPPELEKAIEQKAADRQVSVEVVMREAIEWYLRLDAELLDELAAWQEVRDEASAIVEAAP